MEKEKLRVQSFTDLDAWKYGHKLVLDIYKITRTFPKEEQFGLVSQLRRAIISYTSNIAEGFSRNSFKEKVRFYSVALGSLTEVQNQILVARDIGYITSEQFNALAQQTVRISKVTNGLIKKSKTLIHNS